MRTDSDERSTQSEIYETSDNPTQSRAETTARPTRPTVRPDRLVFPIYRKYLIPNKPSQTKPNQKPTEQAQETQPKQAGANRRQGRTRIHREYLLTLAALPTSTATSDVQSKYSVAAAAAAETKLLTVSSSFRQFATFVRSSMAKPEVHPMFGVLLATTKVRGGGPSAGSAPASGAALPCPVPRQSIMRLFFFRVL